MRLISRRRFGQSAAALSFALSAPRILHAEQPLKMIVVVPPGASMDSIVRIVADKIPAILGRAVVVDYRVGGTGLVAASSLQDYIEAVKRDPALGSIGTSGLGGVGPFLIHLMRKTTGADLRLVAYRGGQPLLTDLIGNHIPAGQSVLSDYLEPHRSGLVKLIGVTTEKRSALAPDISTFTEQGFPELYGQTTMGFFVRGGTAPDLVTQYSKAISEALAMPEVSKKLAALGLEATGSSPQDFAATIASERKRWEPVAREAGIRLD